jgi:hypothetical protein
MSNVMTLMHIDFGQSLGKADYWNFHWLNIQNLKQALMEVEYVGCKSDDADVDADDDADDVLMLMLMMLLFLVKMSHISFRYDEGVLCWHIFVEKFFQAFTVLRRNATLIMFYAANIGVSFSLKGHPSNSNAWFTEKFQLGKTDRQMEEEISQGLEEAVSRIQEIRNFVYNWRKTMKM